jgi:hypothetical protein
MGLDILGCFSWDWFLVLFDLCIPLTVATMILFGPGVSSALSVSSRVIPSGHVSVLLHPKAL